MDYTNFRNSERQGWDSRATAYANATARATRQTIPTLLAHAQLFPGARVLDAGCGPGYVAAAAQLMGATCTGLDFAAEMVAQARQNFPDIPFETGDVETLPMADQSLDAVLSNIVLFHVTDPERTMAEAFRVLKPNGRFVFSQWLGPDKSECYKMLFDVLGTHADMSLADPAPNAYALSDPAYVETTLQNAGFSDVRFETVPNVLHVSDPSFYDFFMTFGVRVPLIVERQSAEAQATIRTEIDTRAAAYLDNGIYKIPMPSLVVSAQRPSA